MNRLPAHRLGVLMPSSNTTVEIERRDALRTSRALCQPFPAVSLSPLRNSHTMGIAAVAVTANRKKALM